MQRIFGMMVFAAYARAGDRNNERMQSVTAFSQTIRFINGVHDVENLDRDRVIG